MPEQIDIEDCIREQDMRNHDLHYRTLHIEPIDVIEQMERTLERTDKLTINQKGNLTRALKYLLRAGTKDAPLQEIEKARNYLHRVVEGKFRNGND